jgi:N-methylhydantoinase A
VTDAPVVAGILRPERCLGGRMTLSPERARRAIETLGLDGPVEEAADSILRVVNSNMAAALRLVSTERGIDSRDYVLVAYGGGGPLHAAMVADELGIGRVLVPWSPGLVSAFGLLVADPMIDLARTRIHAVDDETLGATVMAELTREGLAAAAAQGVEEGGCEVRIALQAYELTVWFDGPAASGDDIRAAFGAAHNQRYGYARERRTIECVNYRIRVAQRNQAELTPPVVDAAVTATFADRASLAPGFELDGPAVIEEPTATTVAPPGWRARVLESGDIMIERTVS